MNIQDSSYDKFPCPLYALKFKLIPYFIAALDIFLALAFHNSDSCIEFPRIESVRDGTFSDSFEIAFIIF